METRRSSTEQDGAQPDEATDEDDRLDGATRRSLTKQPDKADEDDCSDGAQRSNKTKQ